MTMRFATVSTLALMLAMSAPVLAQETAAPAEGDAAATAETAPAAETPVYIDAKADTVVATVGGTQITLGNMIALRATLPAEYQNLDDKVLFDGILNQLIQQTALEQSLKGELSLKDKLTLENERRGFLSGVALMKVSKAAVTDEAIKAAYDARIAAMEPATEYHAVHILVDTLEKANELKAQLDGGADFAELAKANSTDTGSGANGGDLGWFGKGMMVEPFEAAVIAAKVGEVSAPVQTQFGYHLIKVLETRVAEAPTLEALHDELAANIEQTALAAHIEKLTSEADIARSADGIDPAILKDAALLDK